MIDRARGGEPNADEYELLRDCVVKNPLISDLLPEFVKSCRTVREFWIFIKSKFSNGGAYNARTEFLQARFAPVLAFLEDPASPGAEIAGKLLSTIDSEHIRAAWAKALERRLEDPDGAVTSARSLLESVLKYILDQLDVSYENDKLPKLYRLVSDRLRIGPNDRSDTSLKSIAGSCQTIVSELGSVRNAIGDAHGKGLGEARAAARHAELAVNLSGSISLFLLETLQDREF